MRDSITNKDIEDFAENVEDAANGMTGTEASEDTRHLPEDKREMKEQHNLAEKPTIKR